MPTTHVVAQGEHLSLIAEKHGFHNYQTVWDDPANADLKSKRQNPNVLYPGDQLTIPDKTDHSESRPTDARHKFKAKATPLRLQLFIKDCSSTPVINTNCRLDVATDSQQLATDGSGKVSVPIPNDTQKSRVVIQTDQIVETNFDVSVGELDPIDTVTGQIGRLNNLGYDAGPVREPADDPAKMQFKSAVEEFQCNSGMKPVDGICGSQTQAKLMQVHGC
jgi:LysM repeat protein